LWHGAHNLSFILIEQTVPCRWPQCKADRTIHFEVKFD
jgi:hypothetical protein